MTKKTQVYKCNICGNIVEVVNVGAGELVCCGEAMNVAIENSTDAATEKHVPVINKINGGYEVQVGSTIHPMEEKHYIQWIELLADGLVYRKELKPGDEPKATFKVDAKSIKVREYCNLHGLWKGEL